MAGAHRLRLARPDQTVPGSYGSAGQPQQRRASADGASLKETVGRFWRGIAHTPRRPSPGCRRRTRAGRPRATRRRERGPQGTPPPSCRRRSRRSGRPSGPARRRARRSDARGRRPLGASASRPSRAGGPARAGSRCAGRDLARTKRLQAPTNEVDRASVAVVAQELGHARRLDLRPVGEDRPDHGLKRIEHRAGRLAQVAGWVVGGLEPRHGPSVDSEATGDLVL